MDYQSGFSRGFEVYRFRLYDHSTVSPTSLPTFSFNLLCGSRWLGEWCHKPTCIAVMVFLVNTVVNIQTFIIIPILSPSICLSHSFSQKSSRLCFLVQIHFKYVFLASPSSEADGHIKFKIWEWFIIQSLS